MAVHSMVALHRYNIMVKLAAILLSGSKFDEFLLVCELCKVP